MHVCVNKQIINMPQTGNEIMIKIMMNDGDRNGY